MSKASRGDKPHPRNALNDLTGKQWLRFLRTWVVEEGLTQADAERLEALASRCWAEFVRDFDARADTPSPEAWAEFARSWFIADSRRYLENRDVEMHPARYPEEMVEPFILFFTKRGEWVLDPFVGSGATLVSCLETGRKGVGIELSPRYAAKCRQRLSEREGGSACFVIEGDARGIGQPEFWQRYAAQGLPFGDDGMPIFDFIMTSPPYWNMLRKSRGGVISTHKARTQRGLDQHYSDDPADLGNISDYAQFLEELGSIFDACARLLRPGRYLVVVAQNLRTPEGTICTLAWDLAQRIGRSLLFQGEKIWCQNSKFLGIWGYPKIFVPNYHHHYCLIFRRPD